MASGNFILDKGYTADAAILRWRAVKRTTTGVVTVAASTDIALGVVQFGVSAAELLQGKDASVRLLGITEWECGAACALGVEVMSDGSGRCVPAAGAGNRVKGLVVQDPTTNAGDRATVLLYNGGRII